MFEAHLNNQHQLFIEVNKMAEGHYISCETKMKHNRAKSSQRVIRLQMKLREAGCHPGVKILSKPLGKIGKII
jgi:hypothetical protein